MKNYTRKELLALPVRKWDENVRAYDSVLIFNSRQKHDSGWLCMVIVGCIGHEPVEICGQCSDDIEWILPPPTQCADFLIGQMRMDCLYPAGAMHAWARGNGRFRVGCALSSVTIELSPEQPK